MSWQSFWKNLTNKADYTNDFWKNVGTVFNKISNSGFGRGISNLWRSVTGSGLTDAQREANAFEAQQAQNQMAFQERMSNTENQRGIEDMKKAGLNPALMYGSGARGASTPSGAMAASESPGSPDVVGLMTALSNLSLLKAQRDNIRADVAKKRQDIEESKTRQSNIAASTQNLIKNLDLADANIRKLGLEGDALEIANSFIAREKETALEIQSKSLDKLDAEVSEINKRIEKLDADKMATLQSIAESQQRVNNLLAQESLTEAQRSEVFATIKSINQQTENLVKSGALLQKDINWYTHDKIAGDVKGAIGSVTGLLGIGKIGKLFGNKTKRVVGASPYDDYTDYLN